MHPSKVEEFSNMAQIVIRSRLGGSEVSFEDTPPFINKVRLARKTQLLKAKAPPVLVGHSLFPVSLPITHTCFPFNRTP